MKNWDVETAQAVRNGAWNSDTEIFPTSFSMLPTMLTQEELRMLSFLARNLEVPGIVLDLGCFVGGSTFALAHGVVNSTNSSRPIHSFDLFELNEAVKHRYFYENGLPFYPGSNGLDLYRVITGGFSGLVSANVGDVKKTLTREWMAGRDVALLFLDLCKTPEITDHITRTVFPRLRPGSWIVQQDFLYEFTPWAVYPFWRLRGQIELIGSTCRHSAIFRVASPISEEDAASADVSKCTPLELVNCLQGVAAWFQSDDHLAVLDRAQSCASRFAELRTEWTLMLEDRRERGVPGPLERWRDLGWNLVP